MTLRRRARGVLPIEEKKAATAERRRRFCRAGCGQPAAPRSPYCSVACNPSAKHNGLLATSRTLTCARRGCAVEFTTRKPNARYCSPICTRRGTRKPKELRSRSRFRQPTAPIRRRRLRIFERDGWRCWLCLTAVDPALRWPDRRSASLDHVVPLSRGGADDESNLRLAHLECNALRGARAAA